MGDDTGKTIKIRRNEKVGTDSRGRTVWTKPIEPVELELMSTLMLEQIILSDDEESKKQLRALTDGNDGVIACDTTNNKFEVVKDDELEVALQARMYQMSCLVTRLSGQTLQTPTRDYRWSQHKFFARY